MNFLTSKNMDVVAEIRTQRTDAFAIAGGGSGGGGAPAANDDGQKTVFTNSNESTRDSHKQIEGMSQQDTSSWCKCL